MLLMYSIGVEVEAFLSLHLDLRWFVHVQYT